MAFDGRRLAIASMIQITTFVDAARGRGDRRRLRRRVRAAARPLHRRPRRARPRLRRATASSSSSTRCSPASRRRATTHSFKPLWRPPFVSRLAAEDRCHLNGLALRDGAPAYVTAVAETDVADGWRDNRAAGGVVVDVASERGRLPRPVDAAFAALLRRPALGAQFRRRRVRQVDLGDGPLRALAFCPGYLRGLDLSSATTPSSACRSRARTGPSPACRSRTGSPPPRSSRAARST